MMYAMIILIHVDAIVRMVRYQYVPSVRTYLTDGGKVQVFLLFRISTTTMMKKLFSSIIFASLHHCVLTFVPAYNTVVLKKNNAHSTTASSVCCYMSDLDREIEEKSRRRASQGAGGSGIGETAAGAVLGGLLLGPFGKPFCQVQCIVPLFD